MELKQDNLIDYLYSNEIPDSNDLKIITRKVSFIKDPELKLRVIGISDWFTQSTLKPLHKILMDVLKLIPFDATHDQDKGFNTLKRLCDSKSNLVKRKFYFTCYDLKSATDTLPVVIAEELLNEIAGATIGGLWRSVTTHTGFYIPHMEKSVKYNTGQPMGTYTSFPMLALTNHFLVFCASKMAYPETTKIPIYRVLGDDIVLTNERVAYFYGLICSELNIPLSLNKTFRSEHLYDFAKRTVWEGEEISPLPITGYFSNKRRNIFRIASFIRDSHKRGYLVRPSFLVRYCEPELFRHYRDVNCKILIDILTGALV